MGGGSVPRPAPAAPSPSIPLLPVSPRLARFPWAGGGLSLSSGGTGAYSTVWLGLLCGRLSDDGMTTMAMMRAPSIDSSGGYRRAHCDGGWAASGSLGGATPPSMSST